jgi:Flp pilus assembly protein TadG
LFLLIHWRSYFLLSTLQRRLRESAGDGALVLLDTCRGSKTAGKATLSFYARQAARDQSGVGAVEFALILPVLLTIIVGGFVFGTAFNNYVVITNAAQAGTFQLTVSRGTSTPLTGTTNAVYAAAPGLTQNQMTITLNVNGTACTTDSACQTALTSASGQTASVKVSYPCSLTVLQVNYAPTCNLKSQSAGRIQ